MDVEDPNYDYQDDISTEIAVQYSVTSEEHEHNDEADLLKTFLQESVLQGARSRADMMNEELQAKGQEYLKLRFCTLMPLSLPLYQRLQDLARDLQPDIVSRSWGRDPFPISGCLMMSPETLSQFSRNNLDRAIADCLVI